MSRSVDTYPVPPAAGAGFKAQHAADVLEGIPRCAWFEVHPENYMGAGGPPHRLLTALRERYPLSLHGVGLSIGGETPPDADHLARLKHLDARYQPGLFSEHLAWSTHDGLFLNDLLPLPYSEATLARVIEHVDAVQMALGRQILIENPATYVVFATSSMSETDFLRALARKSGCGLLLDVNNVHVSATNHGTSPTAYLDDFPMESVGEIHLAGHASEPEADGGVVLIDAHDRPVSDPVWRLYERVIGQIGPVPTLIEWDNDVPDWSVLEQDVRAAQAILDARYLGRRHG